jgi:hypothetical protein
MIFSPIVGAFSRRPISVEPRMHWFRVPPTITRRRGQSKAPRKAGYVPAPVETIVPLSGHERQSGWVLRVRGKNPVGCQATLGVQPPRGSVTSIFLWQQDSGHAAIALGDDPYFGAISKRVGISRFARAQPLRKATRLDITMRTALPPGCQLRAALFFCFVSQTRIRIPNGSSV